ncbi:MAG: 30S ribosome-binding factor RbfA [Rhodocyclaceae bacterium]|nr:30S ribosome-binding factor RbfA [Rhodocyclaceae bacterium]
MARGQQRGFARTDRVAEQIRRDLAELIRAEIRDPRVQQVSITAVEVTPDYSHAKIFYTALVAESERDALAQGLKRAAGFLRHELSRQLMLRTVPELHFVYDTSVERGISLSSLIDTAVARSADDAEPENNAG